MEDTIETTEAIETSSEPLQTSTEESAEVTGTQEVEATSEEVEETDTTESKEPESSTEESKEVVTEKILSFQEKFGDQLKGYLEGTLGDKDFKTIEGQGMTKGDFELMASAFKNQLERNTQELMDSIGGSEVFDEVQQFALQNLNQSERDKINDVLFNDLELGKLVLQGLQAKMAAKNGYGPLLRVEGNATSSEATMFHDRSELVTAMASHKYRNDSSYRQEVDSFRRKTGM